MVKIVQHHEKYQELHGEDKIVLMTQREHLLLHKRLRMEGKCTIPVKDLHAIALKAHCRTDHYKTKRKCYEEQYRKTPKHKRYDADYKIMLRQNSIIFTDNIAENITLREQIIQYPTGNICISVGFHFDNGLKIPKVTI
jgi:hypothetical protein